MSNQRENISISKDDNDQYLNITREQLNDLWDIYLNTRTDRKSGERSILEISEIWNVSRRTANLRVKALAASGLITTRKGVLNGKYINWIKLLNKENKND